MERTDAPVRRWRAAGMLAVAVLVGSEIHAMDTSPLYDAQREHLDRFYPFIEQGAELPGRVVPDARFPNGAGFWQGQHGWRTRHGEAVVVWDTGRPSRAFFVRYPDGSRGDVTHTLDHGWRRRGSGPARWVYGDIGIRPDDVVFTDGAQPTYTPPALSDAPNLETDLARDQAFLASLKDDRFARAVYKVFQKRDFYKGADERRWSCGIRQAAHLLARLRGLGESYHDYYLDDTFEGVWPDDRPEREAFIRQGVESTSALGGEPRLTIKVPSTVNGERIETEEQAEAFREKLRREFERNRPQLEEMKRETLERSQRQLDELKQDPNGDVFASLRAHLTRLGWRTETADDRKRADARAMRRRLDVLREVRELELRPATAPSAWAEPLQRQRGGITAIQAGALDALSPDEREVVTGGVTRRLRGLALTGRVSEDEYKTLTGRLHER